MNKLSKSLTVLFLAFFIGSYFSIDFVQAQNNELVLEIIKECDIQYAGDSCVAEMELFNNSGEILDGEASLRIDYQGACGDDFFDGQGIETQFSIDDTNWLDFSNWDNGTATVSGFEIAEGETQPKLKIKTASNLCPGNYTFTLTIKGTAETGEEYTTPPIILSSGNGGVSIAGLVISNEKVPEIGTNNATIIWDTNKKATSQVIYSLSSEIYEFDWKNPPNYGYTYSTVEKDNNSPISENGTINHSVVLSDLLAGTTYYYRCISHASPPTISREYTFTTLAAEEYSDEEKTVDEGKVFGAGDNYQNIPDNNSANVSYPRRVVQKADDFVREFIDSFSAENNDNEGKVKGEKDEKIEEKSAEGKSTEEEVFEEKSLLRIWWWLILLLLFLIIAGILYYHRKKFIKTHNRK